MVRRINIVFLAVGLWVLPLSLIRASTPTAVEVQVELTEVDHLKASQFGVEWLDRITVSEALPAGILKVGSIFRPTQLKADVHLLVQEGAAELLANPNLITDTGTTASFHAGGEIPYITSTSLGSTHVEFKPYGVQLQVKPKVLKSGLIHLKIGASVSAPDETNGVVLSGNAVPALLERKVTSEITLKPGNTMTLAGLVQNRRESLQRGIPFLRRIPLLGRLFRWERSTNRRSTIIIFVTPQLVKN